MVGPTGTQLRQDTDLKEKQTMTNLIFDYDGTIHNGVKIYAPAFRKAYARLVEMGLAQEQSWTEQEISHWMGYTPADMWNTFMPGLPKEEVDYSIKLVEEEMDRLIREGEARLYHKAEEVLAQLKAQGYTLLFLSNCTRSYMQAHTEAFKLKRFFADFYCSEDFGGIPKYEIFETIRKEHPGNFAVIGDRMKDIEVAVHHNLPSVGAAYGYGTPDELAAAGKLCGDITEIPKALETLGVKAE